MKGTFLGSSFRCKTLAAGGARLNFPGWPAGTRHVIRCYLQFSSRDLWMMSKANHLPRSTSPPDRILPPSDSPDSPCKFSPAARQHVQGRVYRTEAAQPSAYLFSFTHPVTSLDSNNKTKQNKSMLLTQKMETTEMSTS